MIERPEFAAFRGRRILVVGGAGFVGANLVQALLEAAPAAVVVVDNLLSAERDNLPDHPALRFVEGSIADDAVLARLDPATDFVFHLACYHGNQSSIRDPLADHANNTLTTLKLFERIKDFRGLAKAVYASAGCAVAEKTFGDASPTTEDAPVTLYHDSPYSISKIVGEFYANYYWKQHGLPVVKARFQNVYGPGEVLGAGRWRGTPATVWRNVVPTFVYRAIRGWPLPVENRGVASRDFIFVDDIVRGLLLCAATGSAGEVFNLATGEETSILELARTTNELVGNPAGIELLPARDWDRSGKRFGSTEKARRALGFEARIPLRDGLARTIDWTRKHLERIEACMRRHGAEMAALGAPLG
jgi:nucleoside-diphosphate-sugar epimerase